MNVEQSLHLNGQMTRPTIPEFDPNGVPMEQESRTITYLKRIGRPDLKERLTSVKPWSYWTMEMYGDDIKGQGGLGMLASDTREVAKQIGLPMVFITPFYTRENSQAFEGFEQRVVSKTVTPEERGFTKVAEVTINTANSPSIALDVHRKQEGNATTVTITEPNFGELYQGENNSDHRLYQEVALGFGGYQALRKLGINPSMNQQLNEAPTVFAGLARLDEHFGEVHDFKKALSDVKESTIYTNHTLVQACEASFTLEQFEHYVIPNIKNQEVIQWLREKIKGKGGSIKLSTLAIELSGKRNGVSLIHAREASNQYEDYDGNKVQFEGVTNGIAVHRWGDPDLLDLYKNEGILDEFYLPTQNYIDKIRNISPEKIREIKSRAHTQLLRVLQARLDQYGKPVDIPQDAKIMNWRRRIAGYKRPGMIFEDPETFAQILESENIHFVMAGRAHPADEPMQEELKRILEIIDKNPILKKRVHFVQNYDEDLARALVQGADISVNTPVVRDEETGKRVSTEACGTSWEKDILNNVILISTDDGGVADLTVQAEEQGNIVAFEPSYLQIRGNNYQEEVKSLYSQVIRASAIIDGSDTQYTHSGYLQRQTIAYLPIISGANMEAKYINLGFPKEAKELSELKPAA